MSLLPEIRFRKQIGLSSFGMGTHVVGVVRNESAQEMGGDLMPQFVEMASRCGIKVITSNILSDHDNFTEFHAKLGAMPHASARKIWASMDGGYASAPIMYHTNSLIGDSMDVLDAQLNKAVKGFSIAKGYFGVGIRIPVLPGPMSQALLLSKLAKDYGEPFPDLLCLLNIILPYYKKAVAKLKDAGASCIQFDEPMLVNELESHELQAFTKAYSEMEPSLAGLDVLAETYYGNVSPAVFKRLIALKGVTAIGFDLVRGPKNIDLIKSGFPSDKYLFAGVVDGRSIHRDDLAASLNILDSLKVVVGKGKLVVSTSCPLMFAGVENVKDPVRVKEIESSWLEIAAQIVFEVKTVANLFSAGHEDEIMYSFGDTQERGNADREQKMKLLEFGFGQGLLDTAEELEAHGDINMLGKQASRALGMHAGKSARQKARQWLRCSYFK